ncbi:MAG TPA: SgcJ/EcaC family oxidoreductase [Caulobacterales bacterium]|nr:SgcJ/EcaC family oxidoreductase [Caulobacterales bacterium]
MRGIVFGVALAMAAFAGAGCAQMHTAATGEYIERADVMDVSRRVAAEYAAAWNANDRARFGALFAADARYVNLNGQFLRGRSQIVATHWTTRAGYAPGVRLATRLEGARAITNDTIVAVMRLEQVNDPTAPGGIQAARITLTLARRGHDWVIAQAQASQPN